MSCGVGSRSGSDPALLRLWCGPAATAPYAVGVALEDKKTKKKKKKRTFHSIYEDVCSIPGLTQCNKDLALL